LYINSNSLKCDRKLELSVLLLLPSTL
jgi:hypothetical protein